MPYYIYEHQKRPADAEHPDGIINVVPVVVRQSFASAESYYYDRISKMRVNTEFEWVALRVCEDNLEDRGYMVVETSYTKPVADSQPNE